MNQINLSEWGLSERFSQEASLFAPLILGRVTEQHRSIYAVISGEGFSEASVSGSFFHNAADNVDFPAVGDWVMLESKGGTTVIHHILTRKGVFLRKAAGTSHTSQIVAANIDMAFICMALNEDYNLRRLERYLAIAWDSGATPLVVLTKSDLCDDIDARLAEVSAIAAGIDVVVTTSLEQDGYQAVMPFISAGSTIAFIGSSGVGKSTLINRLVGEEVLATKAIREDGKGRHTTTHRQMIPLPIGAVVIDTPGMRELGVVSADTSKVFADIEALTARCKFQDCSHTVEPGCAVCAAMESGELDEARFENYKKIQTEANYSGMTSRQIENEKINRMFGGKSEMTRFMREVKDKNKRR